MKVLFAAPDNAWSGFLNQLKKQNPSHQFVASGKFEIDTLSGYDVLLPTMTRVTADHIATADRLSLIQQVGAGVEGIDIQAATRAGITVANVPSKHSGNADSVAEIGIYHMLALARDAHGMARNMKDGVIGNPFGIALKGKTVGIVGLGGIGEALVHRLKAFGTKLIGIKRTDPESACQRLGLEWAGTLEQLPELLARSHFVILALPDSDQTHHIMDEKQFALMKSGAFLINLGRGGLVSRKAMLKALELKRLGGAGLDVFWQEPPDPLDPIFNYNVIATPHIAGATDISIIGIQHCVTENIKRVAADEPILNTIG